MKQIFVDAIHGSDSNTGSEERPLRSLIAAQALARANTGSTAVVTVLLRGGTYLLEETLTFDARDSGTTYSSYGGETAVVSGGVSLAGLDWTRVNDSDGDGGAVVWQAALPPSVPPFNCLFADGRREIRARHPNWDPLLPGGYDLKGTSLGCPSSTSDTWPSNVRVVSEAGVQLAVGSTEGGAPQTVRLPFPREARPTRQDFIGHVNGTSSRFDHTYNTDYWGSNTIQGVKGIGGLAAMGAWGNASSGVVHMYHPSGWGGWQFRVAERPTADTLLFACARQDGGGELPCSTQPAGVHVLVQGGWQEARGGCGAGDFFVENVRELLDSDREWFLDEGSRTLFYAPVSGATPASVNLIAAVLKNVVEVRGTAAAPVEGLSLSGLTITHTGSTFLERYEVPSGGDWSIHRGAALFADGAVHGLRVLDCTFDQPSGNALMLSNEVVGSTIANNTFIAVGDSAILAVGSSKLFDARVGAGRLPAGNVIERNLVDTVGVFGKQTAAYFKAVSDANVLRRNVFFNGPRSGVNFNDGAAGGEQMVQNLLFNFVRESGDHGMFNSWDRQPYLYTERQSGTTGLSPRPHIISRNLCLNRNYATTHATRSGYCVDYDDGSSQYDASDNVLVHGGFKIRDGVNRSILRNLVVGARLADPQVAGFNSTTIGHNIAISSSGEFYACVGDAFGLGANAFANQFFTPGSPSLPFHQGCTGSGVTLADWQANGKGYDAGSTISANVTIEQLLQWARQRLAM